MSFGPTISNLFQIGRRGAEALILLQGQHMFKSATAVARAKMADFGAEGSHLN